jgi:pimeloyl-ACP methyl ester carboxylesterase
MSTQITSPAAPSRRRRRPSGRTILLLLFLGLPALIYTGVCLSIALQQRQMLYRTDTVGGGAVAAMSSEPAIPGSETVKITTPDSEKLAGWYIPPAPGQKVMLFLHGQGGRLAVQTNRWRRVREGGYGLLAFSYRGYQGSTGTPTEAGIALDARAAYDWLRQRHAARDIVVHGHSLGSGVVILPP